MKALPIFIGDNGQRYCDVPEGVEGISPGRKSVPGVIGALELVGLPGCLRLMGWRSPRSGNRIPYRRVHESPEGSLTIGDDGSPLNMDKHIERHWRECPDGHQDAFRAWYGRQRLPRSLLSVEDVSQE